MPTDHEIHRLRQVYDSYDESAAAQLQWSEENRGNQAILAERQRVLTRILKRADLLPLTGRRVLDVGCGSGDVLAGFEQWGADRENLCGVDLLPDRVEAARQTHPGIRFEVANAEQLAFPDASFDLVVLFTVLSSILDRAMAHNLAEEVNRVLKPGGAVVWYDIRYGNPRNPNVRGITQGDIRSLFPRFTPCLRTTTLLPPLARKLGPLTSVLYPVLSAVPPLRTHYLGLLVKSA